jgi:glutathione S-transferase
MAARFTLHGFWVSGPSYKVGLMLSLAGEKFDYEQVALMTGAHKSPDYLAKNRYGQVPCLTDNQTGRTLCQSSAILDYIVDVTGKLGGGDAGERQQAREWMWWNQDALAPGIFKTRAAKLGFFKPAPDVAASNEAAGLNGLKALDAFLAGKNFITGSNPTLADVDLYATAAYAPQAGMDLSAYPNVSAWMKRIEALPGFDGIDSLLPKESKAA